MVNQADPNLERLQALDAVVLAPLVQMALGNPALTIDSWDYQPVHGGIGGAVGGTFLYRFTGQCHHRMLSSPGLSSSRYCKFALEKTHPTRITGNGKPKHIVLVCSMTWAAG
jgi:hypothetical protein